MRRRRTSRLTKIDELMTAAVIISLLLIVVVYVPSDRPRSYYGQARVLDGDSLVVGVVETRLRGIDAPERDQTCVRDREPWACGEAATLVLRELIAGRQVACEGAGRDDYDRVLAVCRVGDRELNREMVARGFAVSNGDYAIEEAAAREEGAGLWAGEFDRPAAWRRQRADQ